MAGRLCQLVAHGIQDQPLFELLVDPYCDILTYLEYLSNLTMSKLAKRYSNGIYVCSAVNLQIHEQFALVPTKIQSLVCKKKWPIIAHLLFQSKKLFSQTHYCIRRFFDRTNCQKIKEKMSLLENDGRNKIQGHYNFKRRRAIFQACINKKFGKNIIDSVCNELIFSLEKELLFETPKLVILQEMICFCEKNIVRKKGRRRKKNK